jgi:hypothetical protein
MIPKKGKEDIKNYTTKKSKRNRTLKKCPGGRSI